MTPTIEAIYDMFIDGTKFKNSIYSSWKYMESNHPIIHTWLVEKQKNHHWAIKCAELIFCIKHNITIEPTCAVCGVKTSFKQFSLGYAKFCNQHSKTFKRGLKLEQFGKTPTLTKQKMSDTSKGKKWEERYGQENASRLKNNLSFKFSGRTISDEWRRRISLANTGKLTGDKNPMRKSEVVAKLKNTFENIGLRIPDNELTNFELYRRKVRECSENEFKKHKTALANSHFRGKGFDLDHKFSIFEGFKQGVPVWIIGSINNLEMLNSGKNRQKHVKCTVSLDILAENVFSNIMKENKV